MKLKEKRNKWSLDERINTYAERDLKKSIKELKEKIQDWKETEITDGKITLMITNGGYIKKFEVLKIIDEIMGDLE